MYNSVARKILSIVFFLGCSFTLAYAENQSEVVWRWYGECKQPQLITIDVVLDAKTIYKNTIPVCSIQRDLIKEDKPQKILDFLYAETKQNRFEYEVSINQIVEGNIWESGSDKDGVLLGVSAESNNQILINSIHRVSLNKLSSTTFGKGLMISTYPADMRK